MKIIPQICFFQYEKPQWFGEISDSICCGNKTGKVGTILLMQNTPNHCKRSIWLINCNHVGSSSVHTGKLLEGVIMTKCVTKAIRQSRKPPDKANGPMEILYSVCVFQN